MTKVSPSDDALEASRKRRGADADGHCKAASFPGVIRLRAALASRMNRWSGYWRSAPRGMRADRLRTVFYATVLAVTLTGMSAATAYAWVERVDRQRATARTVDLQCLAENVYYESRGEPLVGQYAVAEVTMNRVASSEFPSSVCAVVHARGAFSWTYKTERQPPYGYEWRRAQSVASSVYDNREAPLVNGALFYHATYVSPGWAATRSQVALIGRHLFYL